jgi:hypothetical protein
MGNNRKKVKKTIPRKYSFMVLFNKSWKVILGIGVLCGIFASLPTIKEIFLTQHEKHIKAHFYEGDIQAPIFKENIKANYSLSESIPNFTIPKVIDNYPLIKGIPIKKQSYTFVFVSGYIFTCFEQDLHNGIDIFNPLFTPCSSSHLFLAVKDNRLYVSVEFKDLEKEETIGIIEFNHWKLYKENVLDYNDKDPTKLEVKDKQNNIVFSLKYSDDTNMVWISGYFIGSKSIIVMPNDPYKSKSINPYCVLKADSNWKKKALEEITLIKSIYN